MLDIEATRAEGGQLLARRAVSSGEGIGAYYRDEPVPEGNLVRTVVSLGLAALLHLSGGGVAAAVPTDTVPTAARVETRGKLEALLAANAKALGFHRWYRSADDPFEILAFYDRDLRYASRLEIVIHITPQNTIGFRVFPHWNGPGERDYIDLDDVRDAPGLMQEALKLSGQNFLFWGMDGSHDLFAGFTITLESGFPDAAVRIVLASVPLVDDSVGDLLRYAE